MRFNVYVVSTLVSIVSMIPLFLLCHCLLCVFELWRVIARALVPRIVTILSTIPVPGLAWLMERMMALTAREQSSSMSECINVNQSSIININMCCAID